MVVVHSITNACFLKRYICIMTKEDFLQIFKSDFHKFKIKKMMKLWKCNNQGKHCNLCLALFTFEPPEQVWEGDAVAETFDKYIKEFKDDLSNCVVKKFTRKVMQNGSMAGAQVFKYVFDVVPKNVLAFKFDQSAKTLSLVVRGYGFIK